MRLLVIDNFDSFTYNLVECMRQLGATCADALRPALDTYRALALRLAAEPLAAHSGPPPGGA